MMCDAAIIYIDCHSNRLVTLGEMCFFHIISVGYSKTSH